MKELILDMKENLLFLRFLELKKIENLTAFLILINLSNFNIKFGLICFKPA